MPRRQVLGCIGFGAVLVAMGVWTLIFRDLDESGWRGIPFRIAAPFSIAMGLFFWSLPLFRKKPL